MVIENTNYKPYLNQIDTIRKLVESYQLPKFKFLWGIDITMASKNTVITFITSGFVAIA
jgi:hypothetical protein